MSLHDIALQTLGGEPTTLAEYAGRPMLVVNVASKCGLTPQYEGLQQLHEQFPQLAVLGFPCNQFMGQEPGTSAEIQSFCTTNYGVSFPMFAKLEVNGEGRHPLYAELVRAADDEGTAGDVQWNFEKFLVGADGAVRRRFRPRTEPTAPEVVAAIEQELAAS